MLILTLRTDKPEAEVGLYENLQQIDYKVWTAHRQLAETIHHTIHELLAANGKVMQDIEGIVCYEGPGSFTGLRIGFTVANALAYSLNVPISAAGSERWLNVGIQTLLDGNKTGIALPDYGSEAFVTAPKK